MRRTKVGLIVMLLIGGAAALGWLGARGDAGFEPVNKTRAGVALRGYDAVAYFREGRAVKGVEKFEHEWDGARWRFASAAARDEFARDPAVYAPQYGGYCSYAVSRGYTADGDPEAWKVSGGKLYLNYSKEVRGMWEQDVPGNVTKGEENWARFPQAKPEFKGERPDERQAADGPGQ
jgi:hypothetical protein